jgi:hypothetical protein
VPFAPSNLLILLNRARFPDRSFDIEFWQVQGDEAIFAAAWEMVEGAPKQLTNKLL